ncbi:hypothetical protein [Pseudomonas sp. BC115LW]|uniref:hypothetical protein n=1 Tax=Pseudomonas sp. BC115LW TaxID=2683267 RepID=UPI00141221F7|nr:hypothetical protein [Pseudomonas sp. BC115LW]NBB33796.1 hypothetical protein [Pseudomonas sp. BC115LW]
MEPIRIFSQPKAAAFSVSEPVTKLEFDLLVGYRRLSSDDQRRFLSVLQAMAPAKKTE